MPRSLFHLPDPQPHGDAFAAFVERILGPTPRLVGMPSGKGAFALYACV